MVMLRCRTHKLMGSLTWICWSLVVLLCLSQCCDKMPKTATSGQGSSLFQLWGCVRWDGTVAGMKNGAQLPFSLFFPGPQPVSGATTFRAGLPAKGCLLCELRSCQAEGQYWSPHLSLETGLVCRLSLSPSPWGNSLLPFQRGNQGIMSHVTMSLVSYRGA